MIVSVSNHRWWRATGIHPEVMRMISPIWLLDSLTSLMLVVAVISAWRIGERWIPVVAPSIAGVHESRPMLRRVAETDADVAQALMAIAMTGMLAPKLALLQAWGWETIFVFLATWFGWRCVDDLRTFGLRSLMSGHGTAHFFHCVATVYMFAAFHTMPMCTGTTDMTRYPPAALVIVMVLVCLCLSDLVPQHGHQPSSPQARLSMPAVACRVAMGMAMAVMLLTMN
jgi:hypothetical protein